MCEWRKDFIRLIRLSIWPRQGLVTNFSCIACWYPIIIIRFLFMRATQCDTYVIDEKADSNEAAVISIKYSHKWVWTGGCIAWCLSDQCWYIYLIIHWTHYKKSDWSRAFNQFIIACELDIINAISAADIAFIMSSSNSAWLPSHLKCSPQQQNGRTLRLCLSSEKLKNM